jgi:hypothetical protein
MTAVNVTVVSVIAGLTRNLCKKKRLFGHILAPHDALAQKALRNMSN